MKKFNVERYEHRKCLECCRVDCTSVPSEPWTSLFVCQDCGSLHKVYHQDRMSGTPYDATIHVFNPADTDDCIVDGVDTSEFTPGAKLYLSETEPGKLVERPDLGAE